MIQFFQMIQLFQIPLSFLFGYFTDFGISLSVIANVIMNSGEAFVKAVSDKIHINFGNVKIGFDVMCVVISDVCKKCRQGRY